jgi:elongator complex protein 3
MPKSYISSEPGAMRAALNKFDPIKQIYNRLHSLSVSGHETNKIEMIVLGGTFDCYTKEYKTKFVKALYDACNTFAKLKIGDVETNPYPKGTPPLIKGHKSPLEANQRYKFTISNLKNISYSKTLAEAIKKNETAKHRIIGLTIETRPEFVTDQHCAFWRELGVTRIEMGIQSLDDEVLKVNKRGNTVEQIRIACDRMRRRGFKISVHIMPGLYMSSYAKDLKTFVDLYTDPFLKPDEIKFYPTSVIPHTKLAQLYKKGEYVPLETEDIKKLIRQTFLEVIPPYTRIKRLIRDIPANEIMA